MTIFEIASQATPGLRFKRTSSARILHFSEGKKGPKVYLVVDHYGQTAALFSDDLAASDWEPEHPDRPWEEK
jgi:hypothetical protein